MSRMWNRLSVAQKLYTVVGIMGVLIILELFTLRFAMTTLSSVRAFVAGEALWSKAQKTAVLNLHKYALSKDSKYFEDYRTQIQVPLGDRQARLEMAKADPDYLKVLEGFLRGRIHRDDVRGLYNLVRNFYWVPHLKQALKIWEDADQLFAEFIAAADQLDNALKKGAAEIQVNRILIKIDQIDSRLTSLEDKFSATLGEGSRWLENLLMSLLLLAVLTVEGTGLLLTFSFSRQLNVGLRSLIEATEDIGRGNFARRLKVESSDEIGQLTNALNEMAKRLEENIDVRHQAEQASRVKSNFLANMSHEIRTPLGAILGFAELLKDNALTVEQRDHYVDIIHRTGLNLSKIINDILDLSKVEAGRFEVDKVNFDLRHLVDEVFQVMAVRSRAKGLDLTFTAVGEVPTRLMGDPLRLRQILMNLLGNAVKFTERGYIRMRYRVDGDQLVFTISDTGIGISNEMQERLFMAFSQVDDSSIRRFEGTGLGLVLSRHLARLLGGDVRLVQSHPKRGSTFEARMALEISAEKEAEVDTHKLLSLVDRKLKGKNVLVVEDVPENQLLLETILKKYGMVVSVASNGQEGIERALNENFDVVLMDVQMPVMDGYTAVHNLRNLNYEKPIIALTAHAMKEDRLKCLKVGYSDYLSKPIHTEQFLKTLSRYV